MNPDNEPAVMIQNNNSPSSSLASFSPPPNDDDDHPPKPNHRLWLVIFSCLQNALVGGLIFGWASIEKTLLQAPLKEGGAHLSGSETTLLFTYASSTYMMACMVMGPLLDARGPRACLVTSHLLVVVGLGSFALATEFWHFCWAVILIAFGGPGIGLAIIHVANLFPRNRGIAISCLAASVTLSFSVFSILEAIWEVRDVDFRTLFASYSLIVAASMIGTLIFSPDGPFEVEEEEDDDTDITQGSDYHPSLENDYVQATIHTYAHHHQNPLLMTDQSLNSTLRQRERMDSPDDPETNPLRDNRRHMQHMHLSKRQSYYESKQALRSGNEAAVKLMSLKDQPFLVQVKSVTFARAVIIFIATSFSANFTIASLTTELEDWDQFTPLQQYTLAQQFTWMMSLGMIYAVLAGLLMDKLSLEVCTLITLVGCQLTSLLIMLASLPRFQGSAHAIMVLGFVIYSLFRNFLYPVFLAYLTSRLGFKYFGILAGIGFALSGVAQCFMANLVERAHSYGPAGRGWMIFHILQIAVLAALWYIPMAEHRDSQRRKAGMEEALRSSNLHSQRSVRSAMSSTETTPLKEDPRQSKGTEYETLPRDGTN